MAFLSQVIFSFSLNADRAPQLKASVGRFYLGMLLCGVIMKDAALVILAFFIPDRLPSLVLLVGFWIPPAMVGLAAADLVHRNTTRVRPALIYTLLATFVLGYAAAWFLFNLGRMPPYIPGASTDPRFAPPRAVAGLAVVASALVLPGSVIACMLAFRIRARRLRRTSAARLSA